MFRSFSLAVTVMAALAGSAQAQEAGSTAGFLTGASPLNFSAALVPIPGGVPDTFGFQPNPNTRQAVTRKVLADVRSADPALAGTVGSNPFKQFGPALSAHGISDTRLDDALAFMLLALWDAANANTAETQPGQTDGVKRQARRLIAASLPGQQPQVGSLQEASESIYLTALLISLLTSKVLEDRDPQRVAMLQDMASRESVASFGVDFRNFALTNAGIVPR